MFFFSSIADVRVYFDQSSYTIAEGEGALEVCVAIDEELGVPVHVALSSQDGTAKGSKIQLYTTVSSTCEACKIVTLIS